DKVPFGSIHGRFQPFHNAHLAYAQAALRIAKRLYVGLTKILTEHQIGADVAPHRYEEMSNPLTYFQRVEIITQALTSEGIPRERFEIGPFPVEVPNRLSEFWPKKNLCFTTIVDDWNIEKIRTLKEEGYEVVVLDDLNLKHLNIATGTEIRRLFRDKDQSWRLFVPSGVSSCLATHGWTL
ncbi:MAG TPA: hypothetical protein VGM87_07800, partial [Roseomonas sp.]